MANTNPQKVAWLARKARVRRKVRGTAAMPRLCVFRSCNHMYAQVIDDEAGQTLAYASTICGDLKAAEGHKGNKKSAAQVGQAVAEAALAKGIKKVKFDRNGFLYHGRVKALAEAARKAGLEF